MKSYELFTIIKPNLDVEEVEKLIEKLGGCVTSLGGKVGRVEKLGRRKLAYCVDKFRDGYFVNQRVELESNKVSEFKRQLRLMDEVIRLMFLEASKVERV